MQSAAACANVGSNISDKSRKMQMRMLRYRCTADVDVARVTTVRGRVADCLFYVWIREATRAATQPKQLRNLSISS